ncbi:MAG: translational GTPase TypA, partial [Algoriella sp.]
KEGSLQMQITSLDYSKFLGRIAVGKVTRGSVKEGDWIALTKPDGTFKKHKVKELYTFTGLGKVKATEVK